MFLNEQRRWIQIGGFVSMLLPLRRTKKEKIMRLARSVRAVIRFRKSPDLRIWRFTKLQAGAHQLPVKTPLFSLGIWSFSCRH